MSRQSSSNSTDSSNYVHNPKEDLLAISVLPDVELELIMLTAPTVISDAASLNSTTACGADLPCSGGGSSRYQICGPLPALHELRELVLSDPKLAAEAADGADALLQGWLSPMSPLTVPREFRAAAGIPLDAHHFCYVCPLEHRGVQEKLKPLLKARNSWAFVAVVGGFAYFDAASNLTQLNAISLAPNVETGLMLVGHPTPVDALASLRAQKRMVPVSVPDLLSAGFKSFGWVRPEEHFDGKPLSASFGNPHGAFVYSVRKPGAAEEEAYSYVLVLPRDREEYKAMLKRARFGSPARRGGLSGAFHDVGLLSARAALAEQLAGNITALAVAKARSSSTSQITSIAHRRAHAVRYACNAALRLLLIGSYIIIGVLFYVNVDPEALAVHCDDGWDCAHPYTSAFYFVVVTMSTVGYGDISPSDDGSRCFAAIYILLGVAVVVSAAGKLFNDFIALLEWLFRKLCARVRDLVLHLYDKTRVACNLIEPSLTHSRRSRARTRPGRLWVSLHRSAALGPPVGTTAVEHEGLRRSLEEHSASAAQASIELSDECLAELGVDLSGKLKGSHECLKAHESVVAVDGELYQLHDDMKIAAALSPAWRFYCGKLGFKIFYGVAVDIFFAAYVFTLTGSEPGMRWDDAVWHCWVTATTVGYGDVALTTPASRLWACFHILMSVLWLAHLIKAAYAAREHRRVAVLREHAHRIQLSEDLIDSIPKGEGGGSTQLQFVIGILIAMGAKLADEELSYAKHVEPLMRRFNALDGNGDGTLDRQDLIYMVRAAQLKHGGTDGSQLGSTRASDVSSTRLSSSMSRLSNFASWRSRTSHWSRRAMQSRVSETSVGMEASEVSIASPSARSPADRQRSARTFGDDPGAWRAAARRAAGLAAWAGSSSRGGAQLPVVQVESESAVAADEVVIAET